MKRLSLLITAFLITISAWSQQVQSPADYLGYTLGDRFTRHHKVVEYFKYVAESMPNVTYSKYGETYEHRPLVTVTLSSQENMDRIEEIRTNNLKMAGLMNGEPSGSTPVIVWLSYNVHGNESVSMEASMQTLFELIDPSNSETQKWLENTVVIMDPCINPDGRDRYANFYNQYGNKIPNPDPNSKEHNEIWPGGRGNHYLFDLNRDWAWMKQTESNSRIKVYNEWLPQIHVDFHEQGVNSPYYFAPAAQPYHEMITQWQRDFQVTIGKNHAKYFDENGWLYFTKERFDLLYPSYGDTYPVYNGAIGMTYEQGGSGRAGLTVTTEFGDELTLKDRIAHHHTNGLSTVEITSLNADQVVNEFKKYFDNPAAGTAYKSFLIRGGNHPDKLNALLKFLDSHKINYGHPNAGSKAVSAFNYSTGSNSSIRVNSNDIVVNVDQPKGTFASILFEPKTKLVDSLTYDITAWSLPYVFGVEAYALKSTLTGEKPIAEAATNYSDPGKANYAYVVAYESFADAQFLAEIQREGVKVRSANKAFSVEGKSFPRGSLIITRRNNESMGDRLDEVIKTAGNKFDRKVATTTTGFVDSGYDFGSGNVAYIKAPKVATLAGGSTSSQSFGQVWYYFEQELNYPITVLDMDYFNRVDLSEYDVLIAPSGFYRLDDSMSKKVGDWISGGGRLIAIQGALNSFVGKDGFGLKTWASEKEAKAQNDDKPDPNRRYEDRERERAQSFIPGAIYRVHIDNSHPLGYGYKDTYFSLKVGSNRYAYLERGWNVGTLKSNAKPLNGFAGYKANKALGESMVFGVYERGRGQVVYMADNPLFRGFWESGKLLFANAVFMVGQ